MSSSLFAAPPRGVARVAQPVPVDRLFEYAVPAALDEATRPGCRVRVGFDRRELTGLVVERAAEPDPALGSRLREIDAVLDAEPVAPPDWIRILREEAAAVLCPVGIALAAASIIEKAFTLIGKSPPVARKNIESTLADRVFSTAKAREELGFEPRISPEDGLAETVAWYKTQGWV